MKLTKGKKIVLMIILTAFVVLLFNSNTVFAAVNTGYSGYDTVPNTKLEEAFDDSDLLKLLAKLIYAVGRFLEWILGTIFKMLTGNSDFPWADKIVFNAVPLLDVNFINPGTGSFVKNEAIQGVLKNLYATILTLAASFFGIVVLVTSIKLVISTIASEKAKYKQAIVDWLVGFVMLFCIHYAISFIFYLNEQLVIVASKMVSSQLNTAEDVAYLELGQIATKIKEKAEEQGRTNLLQLINNNPSLLETYLTLDADDQSKGLQEMLMKDRHWYNFGQDSSTGQKEQLDALEVILSWAADVNVSLDDLQKAKSQVGLAYSFIGSGGGRYVISSVIFFGSQRHI